MLLLYIADDSMINRYLTTTGSRISRRKQNEHLKSCQRALSMPNPQCPNKPAPWQIWTRFPHLNPFACDGKVMQHTGTLQQIR